MYVASLTALAVVLKLRFFEIPYPPAPFLKYDISGIPLALIAFISLKYTPPALLLYFIIPVLVGADPIGMAMKCLAEASTFTPLTLLYKKTPGKTDSRGRFILVVVLSAVSRAGIMAIANYVVTPYWLLWARWATTFEDAYAKTLVYLPHVVIFNATLALIVSSLSIVIYNVVKRAGYL